MDSAGTIKLGGWNHFGTFEHQRFDSGGRPIAVTGNPGRPLDNDWGFYGIIDQLIWRLPGSEDAERRGAVRPRGRRAVRRSNLVDFYADGGITFTGHDPAPARRHARHWLRLYGHLRSTRTASTVDSGLPVARNYEALLEICYTMQLKSGWTLQPDFQYIWQPGGNVPDESGNGAVENAAVFGARSTMTF